VSDLQGEQVGRPVSQQLVERRRGTDPVAGDPLPDGLEVGCLALVHAKGGHRRPCVLGGGHVGLVRAREVQVGRQCVAHRHVRVLFDQLAGRVDHHRAVAQERIARLVVQGDGVRPSRYRVAMLVIPHLSYLQDRRCHLSGVRSALTL
jgi:hypothetical protein